MPVFQEFVVNKKEAEKRIKTLIQHKLRILLKCYTVFDFSENPKDRTFLFKKCFRIKGIRMEDKKQMSGKYELDKINDDLTILKLWVN